MSHPERITILEPWPNDTSQVGDVSRAGVALLFADDVDVLRRGLDRTRGAVRSGASTWIVHRATSDDDTLAAFGALLEEYHLTPVEQLRLDALWAALRVEPPA